MISLSRLLCEQVEINLNPIEEYESDFGKSYNTPFIKGPHKFFEMLAQYNTKVGEIEYGDVDPDTLEIVSIHIDKQHRSKGFGRLALTKLMQVTGKKTAILKAAPSSKKFWKKAGFVPMRGKQVTSYFTKTI